MSGGGTGRLARRSCDIFCRVVDNFGDIGFCWRLAGGLAHEHALAVRLWIDDLTTFARIEPSVSTELDQQGVAGIDVRRWREPLAALQFDAVAEIVVQGFGSPLPQAYLEAMQRATPAPVWIDLEYLSAEKWIDEFHGRPSPLGGRHLVKHFFFPGFTPASGGLLRERGLLERRRAFCADTELQRRWWSDVGLPAPSVGERRLSLFCYPNPAALPLLSSLAEDAGARWTVLVPEGTLGGDLDQFAPGLVGRAGKVGKVGDVGKVRASRTIGSLTLYVMPFLPQDEYDRLLWACDVNFVRGEDSFVRAQWAGRPFIWQIYPQEGGVHLEKLDAFLARYTDGWPVAASTRLHALWRAWNTPEGDIGAVWRAFWAAAPLWQDPVARWPEALSRQSDLASRLAHLASDLLN